MGRGGKDRDDIVEGNLETERVKTEQSPCRTRQTHAIIPSGNVRRGLTTSPAIDPHMAKLDVEVMSLVGPGTVANKCVKYFDGEI